MDLDGAAFEAHRPLLVSIAYRMLGSASEAEDIVHGEAARVRTSSPMCARLVRISRRSSRDRLIDRPRSAERTRLEYPGPWLPEPLAEPNQESAELASSLTTAFLVLLEHVCGR
jgi:RNA polymerase sigma-70 factor (ECF subfamily)